MKILTNNKPRRLYYWNELPEKVQKDFSHKKIFSDSEDDVFFLYKGWLYNLNSLSSTEYNSDFDGWDFYFKWNRKTILVKTSKNKNVPYLSVIVGSIEE